MKTPLRIAALALLYGALDRRRSPIEPALRSLVTVRVSQINRCAFCVDVNSATVLRRGVSGEKLAALDRFESSPLFAAREKAALAYAEAITFSSSVSRAVSRMTFTIAPDSWAESTTFSVLPI